MSAKTRTQTPRMACISAVRATSQILGKVRSGEVQGDLVGKAAPAGRPKSDCAYNKQEKYGASMAALEHDSEKWEPVFRKDYAPPKNSARSGKVRTGFSKRSRLHQKPGTTRFNFEANTH
jgi:hypothetical protein